jgi:hypothetical protein
MSNILPAITRHFIDNAPAPGVTSGLGPDDRPPFMPLRAKPCDVLPSDACRRLVAASQHTDPVERRLAIEAATDYARIRYPNLFQPATP